MEQEIKTNKYLGITIGPIYSTILQADKTREFWLGSYFFSYTMKLVLQEVRNYGEILAQDISQIDKTEKLHGAGIYSDRCYVKLKNDFDFSNDKYNQLVDKVINGLCALGITSEPALRKYLQIYCVCQEMKENQNPIKDLNNKLDTMELQASYNPEYVYAFNSDKKDKNIFPSKARGLKNWYDTAFDKNDLVQYSGGTYSFPSLIEITTKGLQRQYPDIYKAKIGDLLADDLEDEKKIISTIEETFKDKFQMAHKYAVIVNADADNMGRLLFEISDKKHELLSEFSEKINNFSRQASDLITRFGGQPVYIGGDDLLFFSPAISSRIEIEEFYSNRSKDGNIFQFIKILDAAFKKVWDDWIQQHGLENKPSLSYGLSITYYKYPLKESMELSVKLLHDAKQAFVCKNAIAIQAMTHSGKIDEVILSKDEMKSFDILLNLLGEFKDKDTVISSVIQRLRNDELILQEIGKTDKCFDAYFENEYNTSTIKDSEKKHFIEYSTKIFNEIYKSPNPENAFKQLCAIYRLLNFLIHK